MLKSLKKKMKDQAGLTLIELLVVIVILGIIAAVAIPMVMSQREKAETNTDAQTEAVVQDAVNRYSAVEGEIPVSDGKVDSTKLENGYLNEVPNKCANGDTATFNLSSDGIVDMNCSAPSSTTTPTGNGG